MPKKKSSWTPERRKAASDAAKARLEQQKLNEQIINAPEPQTDPDIEALKRQVQEAHEAIARLTQLAQSQQSVPQTSQPQVTGQGVIGTHEKFTTKGEAYPDPTERLSKEPRLARFAFEENYELGWEVQISQYETIDHIRVKEPRFVLKLIVKVYDEDTGELTNRRFVILRGIFHEDPDAALAIAKENGIDVEEDNEKAFLDEMRYLRFRDWLLEAFYPTPPPPSQNKKEVVIGNKLVEVYEVTSDKSESMANAFASMSKKL